MAKVVWTPLAELELEDILFYIRVADGRPQTARRVGEELLAQVNRQAGIADAGQRHPHAPEGWMYMRHKRWLIFYQVISDGIEILRVVDAVRDLPSLFH